MSNKKKIITRSPEVKYEILIHVKVPHIIKKGTKFLLDINQALKFKCEVTSIFGAFGMYTDDKKAPVEYSGCIVISIPETFKYTVAPYMKEGSDVILYDLDKKTVVAEGFVTRSYEEDKRQRYYCEKFSPDNMENMLKYLTYLDRISLEIKISGWNVFYRHHEQLPFELIHQTDEV